MNTAIPVEAELDSTQENVSRQVIPFNKPFILGSEFDYIQQAVSSGHLSGNGEFSKRCQKFFEKGYGFGKTLFTTSCTDALEMSALLLDINPGDEVIVPSYTFVSTANAFALRGADLRFADSEANSPNISVASIQKLLSPKTKAIVVVHYGGVACAMDEILALAKEYNIAVVEDAAHSPHSFYKDRPLGSMGVLSTFSFHETKNLSCGEGGLLAINHPDLFDRAEIIWEKGTNRAAFWRGKVSKYNWVDIGSSFLGSELNAAFLWAQLERLKEIQAKRVSIWHGYNNRLKDLCAKIGVETPNVPEYATVNGHLYYLVTRSNQERSEIIAHLKERDINAVFHYLPLNESPYAETRYRPCDTPHAKRYAQCLVRLPLFYELSTLDIDRVCSAVEEFYKTRR